MTNVIELAKQAGIDSMPSDMNYRSPYYACTPDELERFAALVRKAALEEAAQKLRQTAAGLGIYNHHATKQFLAAIESSKEPTP